jgi:tetratricopeptide (TPR) repeat protein
MVKRGIVAVNELLNKIGLDAPMPHRTRALGHANARRGPKTDRPVTDHATPPTGDAQGWSRAGIALIRAGRPGEAASALAEAVRLRPDFAVGHYNLGVALAADGKKMEAAVSLLRAVRIDPGFAAAWVNLATRLQELGETAAAHEAACHAVHTGPALAEAHNILGSVLHDLGQFAEAASSYRRALALAPGHGGFLTNLARSLEAAGALSAALSVSDAAIAAAPDLPEAWLGRATTLLAAGDFARGWREYAARWRLKATPMPPYPMPLWAGEEPAGRTILLHAEQGLGDTLQFVRFAPMVAARGARVVLRVQPPLLRLLQGLPGVELVITDGQARPAIDLHCPLMNLGEIFAPSEAALAPASPYLRADPALVAAHGLAAAGGALRVGLVWAGGARPGLPHVQVMDRRRSVALAAFAPLAPLCQAGLIRLYSLQPGAPADCPPGLDIVDMAGRITDFADTAAIVAQLDLVISVDTSCAHLAGGMGKPVWLLTRYDTCWRWMRGRADSPWYPTMRIFRQAAPNAWAGVIADVAVELRKMVRSKTKNPDTAIP